MRVQVPQQENPSPEPQHWSKLAGAARTDGSLRRLSHEFGTPLNAILGHVELMLDGSLGPLTMQARDCLSDIQSASHDLLHHSRLLLLLVQALQARGVEEERALPIGALFAAAWDQAASGRDRRGLDFGAGLDTSALVGDPFWLHVLGQCIVDLYLSDAGEGPLRISLDLGSGLLNIDWPELDHEALPATASALIHRITELHGGRLRRSRERGLDFAWPAGRLVGGGERDLAAG